MIHRIATLSEIRVSEIQSGDIVLCIDAQYLQRSDVSAQGLFASVVERCGALEIPLLAQGGYAQLLAAYYGGVVAVQPQSAEQGDVALLRLTPGADDPWVSRMPAVCMAQSWRIDDILELPLVGVPLQNSERTQFQTFKIAGRAQYGIQWYTTTLIDLFIETYVYTQK